MLGPIVPDHCLSLFLTLRYRQLAVFSMCIICIGFFLTFLHMWSSGHCMPVLACQLHHSSSFYYLPIFCLCSCILTLEMRLFCCFRFNGPLRQYFSLYRAVSRRGGERGEKRQGRVKTSKQSPPAPTAIAVGPCPTVIRIVGRPRPGNLPRTIAPPHHPIEMRQKCLKQCRPQADSDQGLHCLSFCQQTL